MSAPPRVSVCIPAYAQPVFLDRALRSLAAQTFTDFEVVVSDDSPDDGLAPVVERFAGRLRIVHRHNRSRLGPAANCNQSRELASGEYVKILHHDDWLPDPDCLGDWVELLESRPDADFAFSASLAYDCRQQDDGLRERMMFCHQATRSQLDALERDPAVLYRFNIAGAPSATIFRNRVAARFDERLMYLVDVDFYLAVLAANPQFAYSRRPLIAITTTTDISGKVTDHCRDNAPIQVFEWVYAYEKLVRTYGYRRDCFAELAKVLRRYGVRSRADLELCGVDFDIPTHLLVWTWIERLVRPRKPV